MDKCSNYREKNVIDFNIYKDRLENIIKTFQTIVENNNDSQIKYITQLNNKTNKIINETMEEKMKFLRIDNSHFAIDLIKRTNELNTLYDKINIIKEELLQEFKNISDKYDKKFEDNNKTIDEYKFQYEAIKKKFLELSDCVKNAKSIKIFGKKGINSIGRKINKDFFTDSPKQKQKEKEVNFNCISNNENIDTDKKVFNSNTVDYKPNKNDNNRFSKSQNNFNNNIGKKKFFGFGFGFGGYNNNFSKKRYSTENQKNEFKFKQSTVSYYTSKNLIDNSSVKSLTKKRTFIKNNLNIENVNNAVRNNNLKQIEIPNSERQSEIKKENIIRRINKEKVNNNNLEDVNVMKLRKEDKRKKNNNNNDELSINESYISNFNNSINTFSTTNDKNNSFNSISLNNNKTGKIGNLFEFDLEQNNKIIKEIASDLEQSTAKGNNLASQKKDIDNNFKEICNEIQPINLKLNIIQNKIEKIEANSDNKNNNNNNINRSEQNTTIFSNNINNNIDNSNLSISNNIVSRNNKLKELIELTEKLEDNYSQTNHSKINNNDNCLNDLDQKMNIYNKKLGDLESFTKEQLLDIIKQMNLLKKSYFIITKVLQKENKNIYPFKLNELNTINSLLNKASQSKPNIFNKNTNLINNENKNILNLTTNYFYKKTPKIEVAQKLSSISKKEKINEDVNLSDNLYYNGNYYFNIKDILDRKKEKKDKNTYENKKLLKTIDTNIIEKRRKYKNRILKSCSTIGPDNNENK